MNTQNEIVIEKDPNVRIYDVPLAFLIDLRHRELRKGRPLETAFFLEDTLPRTQHFGLFYPVPADVDVENIAQIAHLIVSCASIVLNQHRGEPAWQLRGMATDEEQRGKGFGSRLLCSIEEGLRIQSNVQYMWCNSRESSIPFYQKQGWVCEGDFFEIELVGKHKVMSKRL